VKNNLDIILGLATLVAILYRVFQVKAAIYDAIDALKQSLLDRITTNEINLSVHLAIYQERKERMDYLIHALDEKIDHKSNRFLGEIKDLEAELKSNLKQNEV
jgi:hypothetical protein